jgi:hypothetical protein
MRRSLLMTALGLVIAVMITVPASASVGPLKFKGGHFGSARLGDPVRVDITLENRSSEAIPFHGFILENLQQAYPPADILLSGSCPELERVGIPLVPGDTCTVVLGFYPAAGPVRASLCVVDVIGFIDVCGPVAGQVLDVPPT